MAVSGEKELKELIKKCIRKDRKSQQKLYQLFYGKMMTVCLRYTRDQDEAKDILQEGFIKVFSNLSKYTFEGSFEGWIRKIMVNTAIDHFRKAQNSSIYYNSELVDASEEKNENRDETVFSSISKAEIIKAVQALSPGYRAVFNLYVMEGYNHKEIAQILGISEGTSKSNLAKARGNLKIVLGKVIK